MKKKAFLSLSLLLPLPFFLPSSSSDPSYPPSLYKTNDSDELDIYSAPSNIPNAGLGLFARHSIPKNNIICEFRGPIISSNLSSDPIFNIEPKMVYLNDDFCLLGRNLASLANDCIDVESWRRWREEGLVKIEKCDENAVIWITGNKAFLKSLKKIREGEEIFAEYGTEYWMSWLDLWEKEGKEGEGRMKESL